MCRLRSTPRKRPISSPRRAEAECVPSSGRKCTIAIDTFIAGHYAGTYDSTSVGITNAGFEVQQDSKAELINQSDAYGETLIDWIYRGGDVSLQFECKAYKAGSIAPFWPWGALGVLLTTAAPISRLASDVAKAVVLTAAANTPAAAAPATATFAKSLLAPNNPARLLFDSRLRQVPVRLQVLPYDASGGTFRWFATT